MKKYDSQAFSIVKEDDDRYYLFALLTEPTIIEFAGMKDSNGDNVGFNHDGLLELIDLLTKIVEENDDDND